MSRIVKKADSRYVSDAQHFFPLKDSARKHNETVSLNCGSEKLEIQADHVMSGIHQGKQEKSVYWLLKQQLSIVRFLVYREFLK